MPRARKKVVHYLDLTDKSGEKMLCGANIMGCNQPPIPPPVGGKHGEFVCEQCIAYMKRHKGMI